MAQSLSNLSVGAKVKFGKHSINTETTQAIIWTIVAKNHSSTPAYPSNSVTLLTEKIVDLRAYDGAEPTNTDSSRSTSGNNDYGLSNIDQWLNSSASSGAWYTAKHTYDASPNNQRVLRGTGYDTRPGFLYNFTSAERNAILNTTIRVTKYSYTTEDLTRKVFLPSIAEVGIAMDIVDGVAWSGFTTLASRRAVLTSQCYNNTLSTSKPNGETNSWYWWTRSANYATSSSVIAIDQNGASASTMPAFVGEYGIRPALNLSSTLTVSDTTDSDGCYTFIWNAAPPVPTTLNVPTIYGGKSTTISWSKVTDPDGNNVTYQLESSVDGGNFNILYTGTNLAYTTIVASNSTSVQFRLKAIDSLGASSGYIASTSRTVINNKAPIVSGTDSSLGTKSGEFTQEYVITDVENSSVTVTEAIDGVPLRSYVVTLGATNTFSVTGHTWVALANGSHTMTITANDGIDSTVRTFTFIKSVTSFSVQNSNPMVSTTKPTRIKVSVNKTIPTEATFKLEVCNNGFDESPTWEDATSSANSGLVYLFSNTTKTATNWGVCIRVTVNRNGGSGECYISSIGGNFE